MGFDRLIEAIAEKKNPTVAGLDPKLDYVPEYIRKQSFEKCGFTFVRQGEYVAKQLNQRFITREYIRLRDSSSGEYVGL